MLIGRHTVVIGAALGALMMVAAPGITRAQATAGIGDDAIPLPAKGTRIRIVGLWENYDYRFAPTANGGSAKSRLFSGFSRDNFGAADFTALSGAQDNIRGLSGLDDAFTLSFGRLEAKGDVTKSIVPLQIDVGITNRLSLSLLVPYVETRSASSFVLNRGGTGANVGKNPAIASATSRATNNTVATQIAASRALLSAEIARCAYVNATGGGCASIRANPAAAQSLLTQSETFRTQLSALYGTATATGAAVVPLTNSTAQAQIVAKLAELRMGFVNFASNSLDALSRPVGASFIYATGSLQDMAKDSLFGVGYDTLAIGGRSGMGDVELSANFLLLNSLGKSQSDRLTLSRKGIRTQMSGGWRFGTATGGRTGNPFDLPTGDGANALLLRSTTDLIWSRRFWVSGTVRYAKPLSDNVTTRFAPVSDSTLFRPSYVFNAKRSLGAHTELEIAPRFGIGNAFGLSAAYRLARQAGSTINPIFDPLFDPAEGFSVTGYSTSATTVQSIFFGASYSTMNAFVRGKSRWPLEVIYSHGLVLGASGGVVPATVTDRIELRIYTRFPRR
ncbi:MAG: hypothetical protein ABI120_10330 [Gemmatimonadaceae bacterium]